MSADPTKPLEQSQIIMWLNDLEASLAELSKCITELTDRVTALEERMIPQTLTAASASPST